MLFKISSTPNIVFGANKVKILPLLIAEYGNKVILVTGKSSFLKSYVAIDLLQDIEYLNIETKLVQISGEPSPETIDKVVNEFRNWNASAVVAIGGGSVLDAGKAISAMLCEEGNTKDYLEGIGTKVLSGKKIPMIAVPTTSGTGSEATKNAVISELGINGFKKSLRHNNYVPNIALVDPQLTLGCPPAITAASGLDAFTQLLESYLSTNANPITNALAFEGIIKIIGSLEKAVLNGNNIEARTNVSYAALLSGITLANAGLGVVHGFAQPLGSLCSVPHGIVCGTLMGAANRITVQKLREQSKTDVLDKYYMVAQLISSKANKNDVVDDFIDYLDKLILKFNLPKLSAFGITQSDFPSIIEKTGLKYHPVELNDEDLLWILKERL